MAWSGDRALVRGLMLVLGGLLVVACGGAAAPTPAPSAKAKVAATLPPGDAARGMQLFTQNCVVCHGEGGRGVPGLGRDMTNSAFIKGQTDPQLVDFLRKGRLASDPANTTKVDMPPRGGNPTITDAQLADIVAHLRTLQR
jgi:disulfide bond formation protein DsbB